MKNASYLIVALISLSVNLLPSCNNYGNEISEISALLQIAMEVKCHYTLTEKMVYLNEQEHPDFLTPELTNMILKDHFLHARAKKTDPDSDSIFSFSEIPFITEIKSDTKIYFSGKSDIIIDDLTPVGVNPLYLLSENPTDESTRIRRTLIKDGLMIIYNGRGEKVVCSTYELPDMKEFIDTLTVYLNNMKQESDPTALLKVRSFYAGLFQTHPKINILKSPEGNIILETETGTGTDSESILSLSTFSNSDKLRSVTELDPEMNKTLRFELYQGNQLLERRIFTYAYLQEYQGLYKGKMIIENPMTIENEKLTFNSDGKPMLRKSSQYFVQNQIIFYTKQN
jgi:hypothetical protein